MTKFKFDTGTVTVKVKRFQRMSAILKLLGGQHIVSTNAIVLLVNL